MGTVSPGNNSLKGVVRGSVIAIGMTTQASDCMKIVFVTRYLVTGTLMETFNVGAILECLPLSRLKSIRLTSMVAANVLLANLNGKVISFLTPCISNVPFASKPSLVLAIAEEVKLMVGYFSTSNQLALLACVFFIPLPVLMEATSMVTSNLEVARFFSSN